MQCKAESRHGFGRLRAEGDRGRRVVVHPRGAFATLVRTKLAHAPRETHYFRLRVGVCAASVWTQWRRARTAICVPQLTGAGDLSWDRTAARHACHVFLATLRCELLVSLWASRGSGLPALPDPPGPETGPGPARPGRRVPRSAPTRAPHSGAGPPEVSRRTPTRSTLTLAGVTISWALTGRFAACGRLNEARTSPSTTTACCDRRGYVI